MITRLRRSDEQDARYADFLEGDSTAGVIGEVVLSQGVSQLLVRTEGPMEKRPVYRDCQDHVAFFFPRPLDRRRLSAGQ